MNITRNFNLYLTAGKSTPLVINANQYDQGETWVFTLYTEQGVRYTPSSGAIVGIKSDGFVITNAGTVNESGQVVIAETQQMTAAAGQAIFELKIDGDTHGTANFIVQVEASPIENGIVSGSDISIYESLLDIAPSNVGSTGQVLTKTANGAEWANGGGGGGGITVDSALSASSTNPVQNKAIYSALQNKANTSDIPTVPSTDSSVTAGGTNPVNSVAVIAYINSLDATNTSY